MVSNTGDINQVLKLLSESVEVEAGSTFSQDQQIQSQGRLPSSLPVEYKTGWWFHMTFIVLFISGKILPIVELIFFKMVIAPPIRNGFCVYPRGNPLIVTESRWFNVLDVCRIPVAQAGMGRMLLMCFFISPVAGWRSKKRKMFPVGCFGGLACLGIQD